LGLVGVALRCSSQRALHRHLVVVAVVSQKLKLYSHRELF
jgi:hypothetical protein